MANAMSVMDLNYLYYGMLNTRHDIGWVYQAAFVAVATHPEGHFLQAWRHQ